MSTDPPELVRHLSQELTHGTYECMICSEPVRRSDRLWSCRGCYAVLHLPCIQHWVTSQRQERAKQLQSTSGVSELALEGKLRCPLCQTLQDVATTRSYTCYCGKRTEPKVDAMLVPGSCGDTCGRRRADPNCPHSCVLICHPGPCPPCAHTREQSCYCGKHTRVVGCSSEVYGYHCGEVCGRALPCGHHTCTAPCHEGPCAVCTVTSQEPCHCGQTIRTRRCGEEKSFRCGKRCQKLRDCGHHVCGSLCHPGPCEVCLRTPERQKFCPCGKTRVTVTRTSCLDPVPTCGLPCEIPLPCGHLCWRLCHDDSPCGPCKEVVRERCPCGAAEVSFPCFCQYLPQEEWAAAALAADLAADTLPASWPPKCDRVCRKQLSCHKHKCTAVCCTETEHVCYQICTKKLNCGHHTCGQLCHQGPCPPCSHDSYERLYCRCRRTWIDPPVPCGTKPPKCNHPCCIPRPCGHPPNHPCHIEPECPKCVVSVEKLCASHQVPMPYYMPCHATNVSCGKPCGKVLPCCGTKCQLVCHAGPCTHKCAGAFPSLSTSVGTEKKGKK